MSRQFIDTERLSLKLRHRGIDRSLRTIRMTHFRGSQQELDLSLPTNCGGFGRIHHFNRTSGSLWPDNPLPVEPAARALKRLHPPGTLSVQVFQNAVCNWRCWYCYVDYALLRGDRSHSAMLSMTRLIDLYSHEQDVPSIIDISGGQPDLVPEIVPWVMEALNKFGLHEATYLWSDDNLSNDYFWRYLTPAERRLVNSYVHYGKVCCFKGFDRNSFSFNTMAHPALFDRQFDLMRKLLECTRIDLYAYATFTTEDSTGLRTAMNRFVDRLQDIHEFLPLRTVPLKIVPYTPVRDRLNDRRIQALQLQNEAVLCWQAELKARFRPADLSCPICDVILRD